MTTNQTMSETDQAQALLMKKCRENPVFFVEYALRHYTWSKQREILRSVAENKKTAVRACHGLSKTYSAAEIAVWFLNSLPHSKVITTAPTFSQVAYLLWAEINAIYKTSRIQLEGECQATMIKTDEPDHYAIGFSTDKPSRAEGWHAPSLLFIFDEAKGISQWLWDSVRGALTGGFCRWLAVSTTDGVQVGENFYKIFEEESDWNKIHLKAEDSPYITGEKFKSCDVPKDHPEEFKRVTTSPDKVTIQIANQEYIDDCEREWGRESVLFLTKVEGQIVDQGSDTLIKISQIQKMKANDIDKNFKIEGQEEAGVDVARGGADDTVFFRRKGLKVFSYKIITSKQLPEKEKTEFICDELEIFVGHNKEMKIKVDDGGVGGAVTDIMQRKKYAIVPVNFQEQANDPDKYPNAISEMWHEIARIIHQIACPEIKRLETELVNRKYKSLDNKGRRRIESKDDYKKRGFPSPDMADSMLLCFYNKKEKKKVAMGWRV